MTQCLCFFNTMDWLLAVCILILIIGIWLGNSWLQCLSGLGLVVYAADQMSPSPVLGGGWACSDSSRPFGDRCAEIPDGYESREDCELRCLTAEEKLVTAGNIRQFITDRGIKFVIPEPFLSNMNYDDYNAYFNNNGMRLTVGYIAHTMPESGNVICSAVLGPNARFVGDIVGFIAGPVMKALFSLDKVPTSSEDKIHHENLKQRLGKKYASLSDAVVGDGLMVPEFARYLATVAGSSYTANELIRTANTLETITRDNASGVDVVCLRSRGELPHANGLVINHDKKEIFHFEPNVSKGRTNVGVVLERMVRYVIMCTGPRGTPLSSYKIKRLENEPLTPKRALQFAFKESDDTYCLIWSLFGGLMYALNPDRPLSDTFAYILSLSGEQAFHMLSLFAFFTHETVLKHPASPEDPLLIRHAWEEVNLLRGQITEAKSQNVGTDASREALELMEQILDALNNPRIKMYENTGFSRLWYSAVHDIIRKLSDTMRWVKAYPTINYKKLVINSMDATISINKIMSPMHDVILAARRGKKPVAQA